MEGIGKILSKIGLFAMYAYAVVFVFSMLHALINWKLISGVPAALGFIFVLVPGAMLYSLGGALSNDPSIKKKRNMADLSNFSHLSEDKPATEKEES